MISVEFKNSAMETAAKCTNWQPLPSGELNLTKANFNRGGFVQNELVVW